MNHTDRLILWREMRRIRSVEELIAKEYPNEEMRCPTHLSIGQELVGAALGMILDQEDMVVSSHRAHAHYIGKGGDLHAMFAELLGRETGCSGGLGGSMHLCDPSIGFMGSTAIVGNSIPVGVGLGLASQIKKENHIICICLGDGATEEGVFYESINFAAVRKLPILFICENNKYSVYSSLSVRQPKSRHIWEVVASMGVDSFKLQGSPLDLVEGIDLNAKKIRNAPSPCFLELDTFRWLEHCGPNNDDALGYRTDSEILNGQQSDPLNYLEAELLGSGELTPYKVDSFMEELTVEHNKIFEKAKKAPYPKKRDLTPETYS